MIPHDMRTKLFYPLPLSRRFCFRMRCIIPSINLSFHPSDLSEKTSLTFIEFYSLLYQTLLLIHSYIAGSETKTDLIFHKMRVFYLCLRLSYGFKIKFSVPNVTFSVAEIFSPHDEEVKNCFAVKMQSALPKNVTFIMV